MEMETLNLESLCENFENTVLNPVEMQSFLKKLKDNCENFCAKFERSLSESISKKSECAKQVEKSSETISQLTNEKKELKAALDDVRLQQKVVEKKAIKAMEKIENTKAELKSMKEKTEKLSLEIVDLEEEVEKSKDEMKKKWDAVKRACKVYKDTLDIRIDVETVDHVEHVTVEFFWHENPTDKKFFVVLVSQDNYWKVKKIEPELSMEIKYQLNHVVQFSKQSQVANVTSLLCELRKLFLKNYFEK